MAFNLKILTPTTGLCRTGYTYSLVHLVMYYAQNRVWPECPEQLLDYKPIEGSGIGANRERLVVEALETDCTHLLFGDEDMGFAPNALHILASRRQPIVGANYPIRVKGKGFTALHPDRQQRIVTTEQSTGIEPAYYTGFGFCLVERSVFERVERPWFLLRYDLESHSYSTEDAAFGHKLEEAGVPWYCDHDVSKLCYHTGNHNYTWHEVTIDGDATRRLQPEICGRGPAEQGDHGDCP